jgi:hypothetical protein
MDTITFEVDFPHSDSTFPNSVDVAEDMCSRAGLTQEEIYRFVRGNAIRAFGLERYNITR